MTKQYKLSPAEIEAENGIVAVYFAYDEFSNNEKVDIGNRKKFLDIRNIDGSFVLDGGDLEAMGITGASNNMRTYASLEEFKEDLDRIINNSAELYSQEELNALRATITSKLTEEVLNGESADEESRYSADEESSQYSADEESTQYSEAEEEVDEVDVPGVQPGTQPPRTPSPAQRKTTTPPPPPIKRHRPM